MKKFMIIMAVLFTTLTGAKAMGYEQARQEALFLTDKMAYELNLDEEQYEACYEINFDYLLGITTASDLYSIGWNRRLHDLRYMLLDWQYNAFCAASYFYRPVAWVNGLWHFSIYATYPHRTHFYFSHPVCYASYRGGHTWRDGRSWYAANRSCYRERGHAFHGMRDTWRGNHGHGVYVGGRGNTHQVGGAHHVGGSHSVGSNGGSHHVGGHTGSTYVGGRGNLPERSYSGDRSSGTSRPEARPSSTRTTVGHSESATRVGSEGGSSYRSRGGSSATGSYSGGSRVGGSRSGGSSFGGGSRSGGSSFGGGSRNGGSSFGGGSRSGGSHDGGSHGGGYGGRR